MSPRSLSSPGFGSLTTESWFTSTAPALLQPVRLQRLRGQPGQLGTLVLDLSVHPDYGDGMASIQVVSVSGLANLGLASAASSTFVLPAELLASSVLVYDGPRWFGVYKRFQPVQTHDTPQGPAEVWVVRE